MVDPEGRKDLFYTLYERYPQNDIDDLTVVCLPLQASYIITQHP